MLYTFIILGILIIGLIAGMYFSSYQNINEKLAIKKKYLRSHSILFKGPKIKSRISYSLGTIACLLLVFMIFNDPSVNVPFKRMASAEVFNETIDTLIYDEEQAFYKDAVSIAKEINPKSPQTQKVFSDKEYFYLVNSNSLVKINKNTLLNQTEIAENKSCYYYDVNLTSINGIINYQNKLITYGKLLNDNHYLESIIYIHNKDTLKLEKYIIVKGEIENIEINRNYLHLITVNEINKHEDYVGKIFGIKFKHEDKYQKTDYKNIYYIPDNNIKYALGIARINLRNYKYTLNSLLVADYFLATNDYYAYISVNINPNDRQKEEASYIIQYNFRRMKINNSNKVIGRIYNNFIFTKNGNFIVTTITRKNNQNQYNVYTYDRLFYLKRIETMKSMKNDLLVQKDDYFYLVNLDSKLIYLSNDDEVGFSIVTDEVNMEDAIEFNKLLHNKIVNFTTSNKNLEIKVLNPENKQVLNQRKIDISTEEISKVTFENYQFQGKDYEFLNITTISNGEYRYYIIPYIDDVIYFEYLIIIKSKISFEYISHFYIDDYFIVLSQDSILLYHSENLDSEIKIIVR